jgi:hypothetical protein
MLQEAGVGWDNEPTALIETLLLQFQPESI